MPRWRKQEQPFSSSTPSAAALQEKCVPESGSLSPTPQSQPDQKITVFAGQDHEATERARSYFEGNPPTSPAIAILRDGKLVYLMQRFVIEQATAQQIAGELVKAFDQFCAKTPA